MNTNSSGNSEHKLEQASAALRWFQVMRNESEWGLSISEQIRLLGDIDSDEFRRVNERAFERLPVELSEDVFERLSLLVSIYKVLKEIALASDPQVGVKWFSTPNKNDFFNGVSLKTYIIEAGSLDAMRDVYRYLSSIKCG